MGPSKYNIASKVAFLLWVGSLVSLTGCGRDAALTARITGSAITSSPSTSASPVVPTPPGVVISRVDTLADGSSQGGSDGVAVHQVSSGSIDVSKVSVGGNVQKSRGVSASFKVSGGIYVQ